MTPTTPDPASADDDKTFRNPDILKAFVMVDTWAKPTWDMGGLVDDIAAALRQARKDGARAQMDLICDFLIRTTNDGEKYASAIRSGFPVDK